MGSRKRSPDGIDPTQTEFQVADDSEMLTPGDDELATALAQLPQGEQCIEIFRIKATGGRPLYLEAVQPSMFSLEYVSGKFGGGRYIAHGKMSSGRIIKMPFEIDGEPVAVIRRGVGQGADPMPAAMRQITPSVEREVSEEFDRTDLTSVLLAMVKQGQTSRAQMFEEIKAMRELFAPAAAQPQPVEQILSFFQKGLEFQGGGKGASDNPWLDIIKEFKEPLAKGLDTVQMALAARQTVPATPGAIPGATAQPPNIPVTEENMNLILIQKMRAFLPVLAKAALRDSEPASYVDLILDQVPESAYASLRNFLLNPDCLEMLAQQDPNVRNFPTWYLEFKRQLLDELTEILGNGIAPVQPSANPKPPSEPSTAS